ncbi:transcriptional regulator, AraC family [gamma proteobacterium NOR5-3]|nr:transcriptional regulator, AraC family [gamma proteobacterium NOR5-3]
MSKILATSKSEGLLVGSLKEAVRDLLPAGYPTVEQGACYMGISVRTLQRRLNRNGLTYSELVDRVRHKEACRLLEAKDRSIAEIATQLGYSDPSHFSRAFRRWERRSPRVYQRQDLR